MKAYKLTTQNMTTHKGFQWELGVQREATGSGVEPCSEDALHYYHHPLLAVLFNPIHASINNPRLFEIETSAELGNDSMKGWCKKQTLVKELELPVISKEQYIEFSIRVAKLVYKDVGWNKWADNWLNKTDVSFESANVAYDDAREAAYATRAAAYKSLPARADFRATASAVTAADVATSTTTANVNDVYVATSAADAAIYVVKSAAAARVDTSITTQTFIDIIEQIMYKNQ